jgi:hypothetical protein
VITADSFCILTLLQRKPKNESPFGASRRWLSRAAGLLPSVVITAGSFCILTLLQRDPKNKSPFGASRRWLSRAAGLLIRRSPDPFGG